MISLLALIKTPGERRFMEQLFTEHERLMYKTAKQYAHDPSLWDDIVQDSLEKLIKKIPALRGFDPSTLKVYIVTTVKNTAYNEYRKAQTRSKYIEPFPEWEEEPVDPFSLEDMHHALFQKHRFSAAWNRLGRREQILLYSKHLMDMSDRETADILGCKPSSIRMMRYRAQKQLEINILELEGSSK